MLPWARVALIMQQTSPGRMLGLTVIVCQLVAVAGLRKMHKRRQQLQQEQAGVLVERLAELDQGNHTLGRVPRHTTPPGRQLGGWGHAGSNRSLVEASSLHQTAPWHPNVLAWRGDGGRDWSISLRPHTQEFTALLAASASAKLGRSSSAIGSAARRRSQTAWAETEATAVLALVTVLALFTAGLACTTWYASVHRQAGTSVARRTSRLSSSGSSVQAQSTYYSRRSTSRPHLASKSTMQTMSIPHRSTWIPEYDPFDEDSPLPTVAEVPAILEKSHAK